LLIQSLLADPEITYTGQELQAHWIYRNFNILGDAIVTFIGPCQVAGESLVDEEDRKKGDFIHSEKMLHLIVEHFSLPLRQAVLRQRLLIFLIQELLNQEEPRITRSGDDLFYLKRKLSVSIATVSAVSSLIHIGLNISSKNTPLPTANLLELDIKPRRFAEQIMSSYQNELSEMEQAICKVKGV